MPKDFDKCIKDAGKVITKRLNDKEYIHICFPKNGGASISGDVKTYKKLKGGKKGQ